MDSPLFFSVSVSIVPSPISLVKDNFPHRGTGSPAEASLLRPLPPEKTFPAGEKRLSSMASALRLC